MGCCHGWPPPVEPRRCPASDPTLIRPFAAPLASPTPPQAAPPSPELAPSPPPSSSARERARRSPPLLRPRGLLLPGQPSLLKAQLTAAPTGLLQICTPTSPTGLGPCSGNAASVRIRSITLVRLLHGFDLLPSGIAGTGKAMI